MASDATLEGLSLEFAELDKLTLDEVIELVKKAKDK